MVKFQSSPWEAYTFLNILFVLTRAWIKKKKKLQSTNIDSIINFKIEETLKDH